MRDQRSALLPIYCALLFVVSVWGVNFVVMKLTFEVLDPLAFNGVRMTLATAVLLGLLLVREGWKQLPLIDVLKIAGLGLVGNAIFQYFVITGLDLSRPENAALFHATIPVWSALIAGWLGWEAITRRIWIGVLFAFGGVALVIYSTAGGFALGMTESVGGDLMMLTSAILWSLYTVFSKDLLQRHSPLRLSSLALAASLPWIWSFTLPATFSADWSQVPWWAWGAIFFSGTFAIAINYMLWSIGIQRVGAAKTAVFQNLSPVITFIVAFLALQQPIFPLQLLGGLIVLIGVWLTIRS